MSFPHTIFGPEDEIYNTYTAPAATASGSSYTFERNGGRGAKMELPDGRLYRYGLAGASELAAAKLAQNIAADTNMDTLAVQAARAVGTNTIPFTNATTFLGVDEIKNGYIAVESAAALGHCYRVKSNTASASGATTCTATLEEGVTVVVALTTSHKVTPHWPIGHKAIVTPNATATGHLLGVNPVIIATTAYGWFQTRGIGTCLIVGTEVTGNILIPAATAGSVGQAATQTTTLTESVGHVVEIAPTTDFGLVNFHLE